MSCAFNGLNSEIPLGPSHNILHPVTEAETAQGPPPSIDSLPSLEEFCKKTPVVNSIYKMLQATQDDGMLDFLNTLEPNPCMASESEGCKPSDLTLIPENSHLSGDSTLMSTSSQPRENIHHSSETKKIELSEERCNSNDQISNQLCTKDDQSYLNSFSETSATIAMDTNNNHNNVEENEMFQEPSMDVVTYTQLTPAIHLQLPESLESSMIHSVDSGFGGSDHQEQQVAISETDIDNAMQSVLDHLGQLSQKEIQQKLDQDIVDRCLESTVNKNFHICGRCFSVFDSIPVFQVHVQTCIDPPRAELKSKMDSSAMDGLARGLWKQVFLSELRKHPAAAYFLKQHSHLDNELDQIWEMSMLDTVVWCRQVFIKAAVEIVKRKWIATAYANEVHCLAMKNSRKLKAPPKKCTKSEPSDEIQEVPSPSPSRSKNRGRPKKKRKSETEMALEVLIAETGNSSPGTSQHFHFTPETPVSEFGFDSGPASPVLSKRKSKAATNSESNAGLDIDFEPEIERIVRGSDVANEEVVAAAAAKTFESLDESDIWENGQTEQAADLGEDEYVVREILHRRLVNDQAGKKPIEEDYEYLVAWEGYGDDENTWEPYENLKYCVEKLKDFHDSLKAKAQRKKKGKRC